MRIFDLAVDDGTAEATWIVVFTLRRLQKRINIMSELARMHPTICVDRAVVEGGSKSERAHR